MSITAKTILTEKAPFEIYLDNFIFDEPLLVRTCSNYKELIEGCKKGGISFDSLENKNPSDYYIIQPMRNYHHLVGMILFKSSCKRLKQII